MRAFLATAAVLAVTTAAQWSPDQPSDTAFWEVNLAAGQPAPNLLTVNTTVAADVKNCLAIANDAAVFVQNTTNNHQWAFEFAFVGQTAAEYFNAFSSRSSIDRGHCLQTLGADSVLPVVPPDTAFYAVKSAQGTIPTYPMLEQSLKTGVSPGALTVPEVYIRPPRHGVNSSWTYEFAFTGLQSAWWGTEMGSYDFSNNVIISINATWIQALVPADSQFFAVGLANGVTIPSGVTLAGRILTLVNLTVGSPEVFVRPSTTRGGSGPSASWAYEFAFVGATASSYFEALNGKAPTDVATALGAAFVFSLIPADALFFAVTRQQAQRGVALPTAGQLSELIRVGLSAASRPEVIVRPPPSYIDSWDFEFAFVGAAAEIFSGQFEALGAAQEAAVLNVSVVAPLVPKDAGFFLVKLSGAHPQVPSPLLLGQQLMPLVNNSGAASEVYIRIPSAQDQRDWTYEFAFVGANAGSNFDVMSTLLEATKALLGASVVQLLVPPDAFFFMVTRPGGRGATVPGPLDVSLALAWLMRLFFVPEVYIRSPQNPMADWTYEFAFVGPNSATAFNGFVSFSQARQTLSLNASYVLPMVSQDAAFFAVTLNLGASIPTELALSLSLHMAINTSRAPPAVYRRPAPAYRPWAYEFSFVGMGAVAAFNSFSAVDPAVQRRVLNASNVGTMIPGDTAFFLVFEAGSQISTMPSNQLLARQLQTALPGVSGSAPQVYCRSGTTANAGGQVTSWAYEFAFVGANQATWFSAFLGLTAAQQAAAVNGTKVSTKQPSDAFFFVVKTAGDFVPSLLELSQALQTGMHLSYPAEIFIRVPPPQSRNIGWSYQFAFIGGNGAEFLNDFQLLNSTRQLQVVNATSVSPLVPQDTMFYMVSGSTRTPAAIELGSVLQRMFSTFETPMVYVRLPSFGGHTWNYEFAFVGPLASTFEGLWARLSPNAQAAALGATKVFPLVPADSFYWTVTLNGRLAPPEPWILSVAVAGVVHAPAANPPEVYIRVAPNSRSWSYEFAFIGANASDYDNFFAAATNTSRNAALNATSVNLLVGPDELFFAVLAPEGAMPTPHALAVAIQAATQMNEACETYVRPPLPGYRWTYEFSFGGFSSTDYYQLFGSLNNSQRVTAVGGGATMVFALVPPVAMFWAVTLPSGHSVPTTSALASTLLAHNITGGADGVAPEVWIELAAPLSAPRRQSSTTWDFEFAFVGPDGKTSDQAFRRLSPSQRSAAIGGGQVTEATRPAPGPAPSPTSHTGGLVAAIVVVVILLVIVSVAGLYYYRRRSLLDKHVARRSLLSQSEDMRGSMQPPTPSYGGAAADTDTRGSSTL